jgi:ribose 5-phosphate isomerase B
MLKLFVASCGLSYDFKKEIIKHLQETDRDYLLSDIGPDEGETPDYPIYANMMSGIVNENLDEYLGILISENGFDMSMSANKSKYIRATLCLNTDMARDSKKQLNTNILCLSSKYTTLEVAKQIVSTWLNVKFVESMENIRGLYLTDFIQGE